jgi:RNA polymerase sigma-70 factor (ECF subfamily)
MLRAKEGDAEAFAALYDRWSGPILRYFDHLCYARDAAEDFMQEVFLRLWRAAYRYEVRARFSTYLFQIAKNLWINERAKVLRRPLKISLDATPRGLDGAGTALSGRLPADVPDPSEAASSGEIGRRIRSCVDELSDKLRHVFVLAAFEGLPYADVSDILEIPVGTVKSRMWAAVRKLRDKLEMHA